MRKQTRSIKIYNDKRRNIISHEQVNHVEDAQYYLTTLLTAGYTLYDVEDPANTNFQGLNTATVGKYVCVWKTATPDAGGYTITDSWITRHTAVVIMCVKLDPNNRITSHTLDFGLNVTHDFTNKLTIAYSNLKSVAGSNNLNISNTVIRNCKISPLKPSASSFTMVDCTIYNCTIYCVTSAGQYLYITYNSVKTFINNRIICTATATDYASPVFTLPAASYQILQNSIIENDSAYEARVAFIAPGALNFNNVKLKKMAIYNYGTMSNDNSVIYYENCSFVTASVQSNYQIYPASKNQQWYSIFNYVLAISTAITTTNYKTMNGIYTPGRITQRGLGVITRNRLNLNYQEQFLINESLKQLDEDDMFVEWRDQIESTFTTLLIAKINNFLFYKSDGTTEVTTFTEADSFLIIATRDAVPTEYAVMAWYKGELTPTVFSEVYLNELYTIVRVINIWEMPDQTDIRQTLNITNSALEGTLALSDLTSRVVR